MRKIPLNNIKFLALASLACGLSPFPIYAIELPAGAGATPQTVPVEKYYAAADGKEGQALQDALNKIIVKGYTQVEYKQILQTLRKTDADPNNSDNLIEFYSGESVPYENRVGNNGKKGDYDWNRDLIWPNSNSGVKNEKQFGYSDLHDIRPTYYIINQQRGNKDFDYVSDPVAELKGNKIGATTFEPADAIKGDVARMLMYMDVRYEGGNDYKVSQMQNLKLTDTIPSVASKYEIGKLCTLLKWNKDDPVSESEKKRNEAIYLLQGNRNPFIDHPEWADSIYGKRCSETQKSGT